MNISLTIWSWHIWVTERDLSSVEVENFQHKTYKFLPVNLGWCGFGNEWYAPREVKTRLKQAGGKVVALNFTQTEKVLDSDYDIKNGNNPYYQWGRKDPMLPGNGVGDTDKTCFTTDAQYAFQHTGLNTTDIKEYIRNPHKFNINGGMDGRYYNLWSTDNDKIVPNDEVVIKSVYDPSPVGYSLPASNAFTGFTTTGNNTGNRAEYNVKGGFDKGWYFYTKQNKTGQILFFHASGYRAYNSGALDVFSRNGYYWTAGQSSITSGMLLFFTSSHVLPLYNFERYLGFNVRSAEEVSTLQLPTIHKKIKALKGDKFKKHQPLTIPTRNFPVRHRFQSEVLQCPYPFGYIRSVKSLF